MEPWTVGHILDGMAKVVKLLTIKMFNEVWELPLC